MAKGDIWQVINVSSVLRIRTGPGTNYKQTGGLENNAQIEEIDRSNNVNNGILWIKHKDGWSSTSSGNTTYLKLVKPTTSTVTTTDENSDPDTSTSKDNDGPSGYQPNIDDLLSYTNHNISDSEFSKIKNISGVFGLPYQFLPNTDIRLTGESASSDIGYEYANKIVERMPLLFIAPGRASFMTKFSKANKKSILEQVINMANGNDGGGSLEDLLNKDGRYYTFKYDVASYFQYVNPMCRIAARYLEIQDEVINGQKLDKMNWETMCHSGVSSILNMKEAYRAIPFYVDTETSISESFSNSTTQSMITSAVNSVSDIGRELNFLLGYTADVNMDAILNNEDVIKATQNVDDLVSKLLGSGSFLSNIGTHLRSVAAGGKLIFPEIWSDSSFSRSYNCDFKFISPDPSKLSVYLNVLVPLFHLLCLVAPQSIIDNPNGYMNPFLIRATYKGFFNVDMGIITDMSVSKGAECQWTPEGIPTSITVSISIKDLYSALSITPTKSTSDWKYDTMNNTALMDYIANLCGINIFEPEIGRLIDMWLVNNVTNRIEDFFQTDIWTGVSDKIQNLIMNIYR